MPHEAIQSVLVTGSSGKIGRSIVPSLLDAKLDVHGFDAGPPDQGRPNPCPTRYGDLTDPNAVHAAIEGHDALIHLAANPSTHADLRNQLVGPNIIGLQNVLHAAVDQGVRRIILASSVQATLFDRRPHRPHLDSQGARNWYGLTKVFAEHAGAMFHQKYGVDVIAVRIGWFMTRPRNRRWIEEAKEQDAYLSRHDAQRFFTAAVTADWSGFHVLYAMSAPQDPSDPKYDLQPSREVIGYTPEHRYPEGLIDTPNHRASA
ncbi:MAG: NAD(P)-dependent oxidoreductase [Planctomycetota bacterium]